MEASTDRPLLMKQLFRGLQDNQLFMSQSWQPMRVIIQDEMGFEKRENSFNALNTKQQNYEFRSERD